MDTKIKYSQLSNFYRNIKPLLDHRDQYIQHNLNNQTWLALAGQTYLAKQSFRGLILISG